MHQELTKKENVLMETKMKRKLLKTVSSWIANGWTKNPLAHSLGYLLATLMHAKPQHVVLSSVFIVIYLMQNLYQWEFLIRVYVFLCQ